MSKSSNLRAGARSRCVEPDTAILGGTQSTSGALGPKRTGGPVGSNGNAANGASKHATAARSCDGSRPAPRLLDRTVLTRAADAEKELGSRVGHGLTGGIAQLDGASRGRVLEIPAAGVAAVVRARHVVAGDVVAGSITDAEVQEIVVEHAPIAGHRYGQRARDGGIGANRVQRR